MGRYLLCGKEAELPFEVEELDLRIYTIEELCYFIYHHLPVIGDDFIDERLIQFIYKDLSMPEIAEKIRRFYGSPADQDATLLMLLSEVGYYSDLELQEFQGRLVSRRRKNQPERMKLRADSLKERKRYQSALRCYRALLQNERDNRITPQFMASVLESSANCLGQLCRFREAMENLCQVYELTREERVLKKIYDTCVLSGEELPEKYFRRVPDETLSSWQQDYWNRETVKKENLPEDPVMQIFFRDQDSIFPELGKALLERKEMYRGMME